MGRLMAVQVRPELFSFGNAFLQGQDQAQQQQQRNAMLDMDRQRFAREDERFAMQQDQYNRGVQADEAAGQQQEQARKARASLLAQAFGLDPQQADEMSYEPESIEIIAEIQKAQRPEQEPEAIRTLRALQGDPALAALDRSRREGSGSEPAKPQLIEVPMPDGSMQKRWVIPGQEGGQDVGSPTFSRQTQISPKDLVTARNKLNVIKLARQQLNHIKQKFEGVPDKSGNKSGGIKGTGSAGKLQGWVPTPAGEGFDKAVDLMRGTLTSLTKVPGIGAMSDYETRLDQAKFPSRGDFEEVTADNIQQLDAMLNAIEVGYSDLISQGPVQAGQDKPGPAGVVDFSQLPP